MQASLKRILTVLPPGVARSVKRVGVHPRYWRQRRRCRRGFAAHGARYEQNVVFVAGLPKSGTTWLERMLSDYPGFEELLIPDVARHELATGGSHDYELPDDLFDRFHRMLVLTKMHVHGSPHNASVIHRSRLRYVVLYRDLRDVAVSNYFYVRQTPWHPEYPIYGRLPLEEALALFAVRTLPAYAEWMRSWRRNADPERCLEMRYEDMLADTVGTFGRVSSWLGLSDDPEEIERIVEAHRFKRLSGGRAAGAQDTGSFFRRGVAGDWRNHFTPGLTALYRAVIGDLLVEYGYERDLEWTAETEDEAAVPSATPG